MQLNQLISIKKIRYGCLITISLLLIGYFTPRKWSNERQGCDFQVCVYDTGIHTNIVVPVRNAIFDWHKYLPVAEIGTDRNTSYKYLSFGWGDRTLYMQPSLADLDIFAVLQRLFIPHPSVIYVQGYPALPSYLRIKCVGVSQTGYLQLIAFIKNTFQVDEGRKILVADAHRFRGSFYEARGSYLLWRNCNSWTAAALRTADINTPLWDGLSSAIMWHLGNDEC